MSRRRRSGLRPRRLLTPALRFRVSEMHMLCHRKTSPRSQAGRFNHVVDLAWLERDRVRPDAEAALLVYTLDPCRQRRPLGAVLVVIHALDFQRSEANTSELQSLIRPSNAVFCL